MNLEQKVTEGRALWIQKIDYDQDEKRLIIELINCPDDVSSSVRTLTFTDVEDFSEEVYGEEEPFDSVLDSLIGLDECPGKATVKYVVHTEVRELIFRAKGLPQISDVP